MKNLHTSSPSTEKENTSKLQKKLGLSSRRNTIKIQNNREERRSYRLMEDLVKLDRARQRGLARSIECCNWEALRSPWRGAASRPVSSNVKTHVAIAGAGLGTADRIRGGWQRRFVGSTNPGGGRPQNYATFAPSNGCDARWPPYPRGPRTHLFCASRNFYDAEIIFFSQKNKEKKIFLRATY